MEEAPDVFRVDKPGSKVVVLCDTPSVSLRERVALAVEHCPTRALSIEDS
ncbi:MAG: ferredoxin [Deltaproteobacteria bacterium]|nr:ferredoxin [Deltaproteobacteria bacterium]